MKMESEQELKFRFDLSNLNPFTYRAANHPHLHNALVPEELHMQCIQVLTGVKERLIFYSSSRKFGTQLIALTKENIKYEPSTI